MNHPVETGGGAGQRRRVGQVPDHGTVPSGATARSLQGGDVVTGAGESDRDPRSDVPGCADDQNVHDPTTVATRWRTPVSAARSAAASTRW